MFTATPSLTLRAAAVSRLTRNMLDALQYATLTVETLNSFTKEVYLKEELVLVGKQAKSIKEQPSPGSSGSPRLLRDLHVWSRNKHEAIKCSLLQLL